MPTANEQHQQLIDRLLTDGFNRAAGSLLNQMADLPPNIQQRLKDLEEEANRLKAAGLKLDPDSAYLRALLADTETWLNSQRGLLDAQGARIQLDGADAGQSAAQQMTGLYTDDAYKARAAQVLASWNRVSADQLASLVDLVGTDAWRAELGSFPDNVINTLTDVTIRGFIEGWNPLKTARELRKVTEVTPVLQAENLLRTLYNVSSRRGMQAVYLQNADILEYQIRVGTLDTRICTCCIALHGTRLELNEPVLDHHRGRCVSVVKIRNIPLSVPTGVDWFNGLPESEQLGILGYAGYQAWKAGAVTLADFVKPYQDDLFGEMIQAASLKGILGEAARKYYKYG
jgi:hypothetical protein